jgi:hypothetical protein
MASSLLIWPAVRIRLTLAGYPLAVIDEANGLTSLISRLS